MHEMLVFMFQSAARRNLVGAAGDHQRLRHVPNGGNPEYSLRHCTALAVMNRLRFRSSAMIVFSLAAIS